MKKVLTVFILVCVLVLGMPAYASAGQDDGNAVADMIDTALSGWVEDGRAVGAVASIVRDGEVVLSQGYGYADRETGIAADPADTPFRIGSVSKVFTAQAAMHLMEQGKLDMQRPIADYLGPDFPVWEHPVRMHDLLTHTAGFEETGVGLFMRQEDVIPSLGKALRKNRPEQVFAPGEVGAYSNYGIGLAGYVMERIAGESFDAYARESIFAPLGMEDTTFSQEEALPKGYGPDGEERREGVITWYPCGSAATTAEDMAKYMAFLLADGDSGVLGREARDTMFARQFSMDEEFPGIGYVWGRYAQNGHLFYGHIGATDNFNAMLFLCPDRDLGVFISCNTQLTDTMLGRLWGRILDTLYGEAQSPAAEVFAGDGTPMDIGGNYVPARSNFTSGETITRIPETLRIAGSPETGFTIGDTKLIRVGGGRYFYPAMGYISFVEKNGSLYMAGEEGASCLRVPWYEGLGWQVFVVGAFIFLCTIAALMSIVVLVRSIKRKAAWGILVSAIAIVLFFLMGDVVGRCVQYFSDYEYALGGMFLAYLRAVTTVLMLMGWGQLITTIYLWAHRALGTGVRIVYSLSSVSFVLFMLWLFQVNLIG